MIATLHQDQFLEEGYFRTGHTIRRTRFLFVEHQMYSTIWSRVDLQSFRFRKSHRKLLKRNEGKFRYEVLPYTATRAQDELYERYQRSHPLDVGRTLEDVFGNQPTTHDFDTYRCLVYEGERLVAFSCFDLGGETLASIFAAYEPEYARYSLGFYSMLLELEYGRAHGFRHYHPGYCVPGLGAFTYKLRLPNLEGRTFLNRVWRPMDEVIADTLPHQLLEAKTEQLERAAERAELCYDRLFMPLSEILPAANQEFGPMPLPVMLAFGGSADAQGEFFAGYDPEPGRYVIWYGVEAGDLALEPDFSSIVESVPKPSSLKFYGWRTELGESDNPVKLMLALALHPGIA